MSQLVHFPYGHPWSCGATFGEQTGADRAEVTCSVCVSEMELFPDRDPDAKPDKHGEYLAERVRAHIEEGRWDEFLDTAKALYRHATRRRPEGSRRGDV